MDLRRMLALGLMLLALSWAGSYGQETDNSTSTTAKPGALKLLDRRLFQNNSTSLSFIIPAFTFFPYLRRLIPNFFTSETVQGRGFNATTTTPEAAKSVVASAYIWNGGAFCSMSHLGAWRDLSTCSSYYLCRAKPNPPTSCGSPVWPLRYSVSSDSGGHEVQSLDNGCVQLIMYTCKAGWVYDQNKGRCAPPTNSEDRILCSKYNDLT